jgi:hypothetical protein
MIRPTIIARPRTIAITMIAKVRVVRPRAVMKSLDEDVPVGATVGTADVLVPGTVDPVLEGALVVVPLLEVVLVTVLDTVLEGVLVVVPLLESVLDPVFIVLSVVVVSAIIVDVGGSAHSVPVYPLEQLHEPSPSGPELHNPLVPQFGQIPAQSIPK